MCFLPQRKYINKIENAQPDKILVERFLFVMKLCSATIVLQTSIKALILRYFDSPQIHR